MIDIYCPYCEIEFEGDDWEDGNCPQCKREYHLYEQCTEDYSDCWTEVEWEEEPK